MPAERTLAAALGVSRATVTGAYDRLREQGYVESRQGAGSWVTLPGGHRSAPDAIVGGPGLDMRIAALPAPAVLEELFAAAAHELPAGSITTAMTRSGCRLCGGRSPPGSISAGCPRGPSRSS